MIGHCELCGEAFEATQPHKRFCSEDHRRAAERKRHSGKPKSKTMAAVCRWCGVEFMAEPKRGRFCCKSHAAMWGNAQRPEYQGGLHLKRRSLPVVYAHCVECGALFVKRNGAKVCGPACRSGRFRRQVRDYGRRVRGTDGCDRELQQQQPGAYVCDRCGEPFIIEEARTQLRRYCSKECNRRASVHRRRIRLRDAPGTHTGREWRVLLERWSFRCAYCGRKLHFNGDCTDELLATRDHIIPLADGGSDNIDNIVPACLRCNGKKNRTNLSEYAVDTREQLAMGAVLVTAEIKKGNTVRNSVVGPAHVRGAQKGTFSKSKGGV